MRSMRFHFAIALVSIAMTGEADAKETVDPIRRLQKQIDRAPPGSTLSVPAGQFVGQLRITQAITLRGAGSKKTFIRSNGKRATLMIQAPKGERVVVRGISFTSNARVVRKRGVAVMLTGPGDIEFDDVAVVRAIPGRCLSSAIALERRPKVFFNKVTIRGHECYLAGAMVVPAGAEVQIRKSKIVSNRGALAGAFLLLGGKLTLDETVFDGNKFERGKDGHHIVVGEGRGHLRMRRVQFKSDRNYSIGFERGAQARIEITGMSWPEQFKPKFVQKLAVRRTDSISQRP